MCTPIVLTEASRKGTKYNVLCPSHGPIGTRYIAYDAEDLAIAHEVHEMQLALAK